MVRILADPITVGLINSAQVVASIFSALTTGTIYSALRTAPTQTQIAQAQSAWSHITANMMEALLILLPFLVVCGITIQLPEHLRYLTLATIGLFVLSQRFFGIVESMFMALSRSNFVAKIRLLHIVELIVALMVVVPLGPVGYLAVTPIACLAIGALALRNLPSPKLTRPVVVNSLKLSAYGGSIAAEKLLSSVASTLDSILVSVIFGPAALAGYFIGVSVRGAFGNLTNSLYWTLWPRAVSTHENVGSSTFSSPSISLRFSVIALISCVLAENLVGLLVTTYLTIYVSSLPAISILIASIAPLAITEWERARLVVEKRTAILPYATALKIFVFLLLLFLFATLGYKTTEVIAWSSFISIYAHMLAITLISIRHDTPRIKLSSVLTKTVFAGISAIYLLLN